MANPTYSPANTLYSAVRLSPPARIGPFFVEYRWNTRTGLSFITRAMTAWSELSIHYPSTR